ncbi:MAG: hypothetical protein AAFR83_10360 [Cyanobacteria bacterium J06629_18]
MVDKGFTTVGNYLVSSYIIFINFPIIIGFLGFSWVVDIITVDIKVFTFGEKIIFIVLTITIEVEEINTIINYGFVVI